MYPQFLPSSQYYHPPQFGMAPVGVSGYRVDAYDEDDFVLLQQKLHL